MDLETRLMLLEIRHRLKSHLYSSLVTKELRENIDFVEEKLNAYKAIQILTEKLNEKYYSYESELTREEVRRYSNLQQDVHRFCEERGIVWRVDGGCNLIILSNTEIFKNILDAGYEIASEWLDLLDPEVEGVVK